MLLSSAGDDLRVLKPSGKRKRDRLWLEIENAEEGAYTVDVPEGIKLAKSMFVVRVQRFCVKYDGFCIKLLKNGSIIAMCEV